VIRPTLAPSPSRTLVHFGFRQAMKGAIILGLVAALMLVLQGTAYQKAYATHRQQVQLAQSLANAPGLGFLYGDPANLRGGTAGYIVYRTLGFMGVVVAVWALMTVTKMLRGAEEDGRWEVIRSGATTSFRATYDVVRGFIIAWLMTLVLSFVISWFAISGDHITMTAKAMLLLNLAIFLPGLAFAGVGIFVSQLAQSRGRALIYGIAPMAAFFLMRGAGNTSQSLHWLLYITPFGWNQLVNPVLSPDTSWLLPIIILGALFAIWGLVLTKRDYGEGIISEPAESPSHFVLLTRPWQLALPQNTFILTGWAIGALIIVSLISGLANTASNALESAGKGLTKSVHVLSGGTNNLKIAFLGAGILFMIMVLLIMSINLIGGIRRDEAKQYLDNILVEPQRRSSWLLSRLVLAFIVVLGISLLGGLALYAIAASQGIAIDIAKTLTTCICAVGSIGVLIGLGSCMYGLAPRFAVVTMYIVVGWSFLIILIASADPSLNHDIMRSSLFHYTNFNLAQWPDWTTFGWMLTIGCALSAIGVRAFTARDIAIE
jgi:ABC-2 type transport system permease protein